MDSLNPTRRSTSSEAPTFLPHQGGLRPLPTDPIPLLKAEPTGGIVDLFPDAELSAPAARTSLSRSIGDSHRGMPVDLPSPASSSLPALRQANRSESGETIGKRRSPWTKKLMLGLPVALLAGMACVAAFSPSFRSTLTKPFGGSGASSRPELILRAAKLEYLQVTVVERGTLESADNKDVVCKVKAGSKGTFASTIRWVIDDGSIVTKGQLLMELDDSALQDASRAQSIVVEKAKAEWINAEEDSVITSKTNQSEIATAIAALKLAELDLDKYTGMRVDPLLAPFAAVFGSVGMVVERGEFRQKFDDVSSRLKLAESDLEAYRDRSAWAERAVRLKYITPSQAKVEQSKLASALDNVAKLAMEKNILENFLRQRDTTDLLSKLEVAKLGLDKSQRQSHARDVQAEATRKTKYSVYHQELEKLKDTEEQIRECKVYSPQQGMVVYYKENSGRFGNSSEGMIAQGAQVKEGQKLMRIPDLRRMQVNTKVHEAMVARIRGDDRVATGYMEFLRLGMYASPDAWSRLATTSEQALTMLREHHRDKEYREAAPGQKARVRVDAIPDRILEGHVRTVAAVASQNDFFSADVKVYQTLVIIDDNLEELKLKPDMSAEVTIQIDPPKEPTLCVPVQAVVGGAEGGNKRRIYVMTPDGPVERVIEIGVFNDTKAQVLSGLVEDEMVILNPKLVNDKAKTREEVDPVKSGRAGGGGQGKSGKAPAGGEGKKKA